MRLNLYLNLFLVTLFIIPRIYAKDISDISIKMRFADSSSPIAAHNQTCDYWISAILIGEKILISRDDICENYFNYSGDGVFLSIDGRQLEEKIDCKRAKGSAIFACEPEPVFYSHMDFLTDSQTKFELRDSSTYESFTERTYDRASVRLKYTSSINILDNNQVFAKLFVDMDFLLLIYFNNKDCHKNTLNVSLKYIIESINHPSLDKNNVDKQELHAVECRYMMID